MLLSRNQKRGETNLKVDSVVCLTFFVTKGHKSRDGCRLCAAPTDEGDSYTLPVYNTVFWAAETRLEEKKSQENACPKFVLQLLVRHHNEFVSSFITFGRLLLAHFTDFRPTWVHLVPHWKAIPSSSHCPSVFLLFSFCPVSFVACVRLEEKKDDIKNGRKKNE